MKRQYLLLVSIVFNALLLKVQVGISVAVYLRWFVLFFDFGMSFDHIRPVFGALGGLCFVIKTCSVYRHLYFLHGRLAAD